MNKYVLWLETEYYDGGTFRREIEFDTYEQATDFINQLIKNSLDNKYCERVIDYEITCIEEY